jgi:HK97 family phage prohead protease
MIKRHFITSLELRSAEEGAKPTITGYAAKFDSLSLDLGGFKERIAPGAFAKSLADASNDIVALFGHNWNEIIGRCSAGTLTLAEDEVGLAVTIVPDDTTWSQNAVASVRSGNIKGMSFAFEVLSESWDRTTKIRTLNEVILYEVSLVSLPAYPATEASLRSADLEEITTSFSKAEENRDATCPECACNCADCTCDSGKCQQCGCNCQDETDNSRQLWHQRQSVFLRHKYAV